MCARFRILSCWVSQTNMSDAIEKVQERIVSGQGGYVCFTNVHTVVTSESEPRLRNATNESFMSMPDGKPVAQIGRWRAGAHVSQVAGPDFMPLLLQSSSGLRHFFVGGSRETLERLVEWVRGRFPDVTVVGAVSPPFRALDERETRELLASIRASRPDVVWVGLGAPKQELWMAQHRDELSPAVLMGVGAAFDFLAGDKARAPGWMRRWGLEWLHRLCQEPNRLAGRYLRTNSLFLFLLMKDLLTSIFSNRAITR